MTRATVLPPPDCDLQPFVLRRLPGPRAKGWPGREADLADHVQRLRPEFGGCSEAARLAATIVVIRRDPADADAVTLFNRLTGAHGPQLAAELSLRWLISVCDTVADLPDRSLAERAIAMLGASLANVVKLAETERRLYHPPRPWPPQRRFAVGHEMFDGLKAYWPGGGDMIVNLIGRLGALLDDPQARGLAVTPFATEILLRLTGAETVIGRMAALKGESKLPLVDDAMRAALAVLTRRL